ncbi:hypothetical protein FRB99_005685 [Tulasnella sp. 403]|nr:hypothetical protein FRB99_005685 [Tulasnella sp. 403]
MDKPPMFRTPQQRQDRSKPFNASPKFGAPPEHFRRPPSKPGLKLRFDRNKFNPSEQNTRHERDPKDRSRKRDWSSTQTFQSKRLLVPRNKTPALDIHDPRQRTLADLKQLLDPTDPFFAGALPLPPPRLSITGPKTPYMLAVEGLRKDEMTKYLQDPTASFSPVQRASHILTKNISVEIKDRAKLAVQRVRTIQEKKCALAKKSRRDIATLLEKRKIETARIRVETMINEDIHIELLELLELYCELLIARFGILDLRQATHLASTLIIAAVCAVIHAAPRTEVKELHVLREMLTHKYGRDFSIAVMENRDSCVPDRIMSKLEIFTPNEKLVNAYLDEIARAYGVDWASPDCKDNDVDDDQDGGGGLKEGIPERELEPPLLADPLPKPIATADKPAATGTPTIPSLPPTEDEKPALAPAVKKTSSVSGSQPKAPSPAPPAPAGDVEDDFEALARRFAALKKR